ncbi:hypothetical protein HGRIS_005492 [Hohenbuehelia grisea]|uniref:Alpha-L-arabinofuranosidase n=1 Tax=Hohenbuehelia grisea TaxID=104357 RepID=A0ABR3JXW5_9AGAR
MRQALAVIATTASVALAAAPLYGQCGGSGWTGATTCDEGICVAQNIWYSQCVPGQATSAPPTSTAASTTRTSTTAASPTGTNLPSSFAWSSSAVLISPKSDSRKLAALKDPSIVFYNGKYHVFASTAQASGYNLVYLSFTDFNQANSATFTYLDQTPIGTGYRAAPQVFFMAPQNKWYLIYQNGNAAYSTNSDISNPSGWTAPKTFYTGTPSTITNNIGNGYWVDMWVICDTTNCHLFSSDDNGHLYRSQTSLANFPNGMSEPVIALQDANKNNLFEASNVYKVGSRFLLVVECIGSDGRRYFRSWSASSLSGAWTALAATQAGPFAGAANVAFSGTAWTKDISHGELVRTNVDQTMSVSACGMRYLYQGISPTASGDYNSLPWRLALLTQTSGC